MKNIIADAYDKLSKSEIELIRKIAKRALNEAKRFNIELDLMSVEMDLSVVHTNCGGLRLEALLESDDSNFAHDAFGIIGHLDRDNFELNDFFVPRFAL